MAQTPQAFPTIPAYLDGTAARTFQELLKLRQWRGGERLANVPIALKLNALPPVLRTEGTA